MDKKKYIKLSKIFAVVTATTIVLLSPLVGLRLYGKSLSPKYSKTFYAALVDKYNRLEKISHKKKIIMIGGSGTAFGYDSPTIKKYFKDYEVQNFGLYGDLGIKLMLDLSLKHVHKGDIVVISPEVSDQTMSLYFNAVSYLKATEERTDTFKYLESKNRNEIYGNYIKFLKEKKEMDPNMKLVGVYQRKNFNEFGDIKYCETIEGISVSQRASNAMALKHDPNTPIYLTENVIKNDFIDYLNSYYLKASIKSAKVLYDFSPLNKLAIKSTEAEKIKFIRKLTKKLDFPIIGNIDDHILPYEYFYDSNFHTNDAGSVYNSLMLVRDLKTYFKDPSKVEKVPDKPTAAGNIYTETEEDIKWAEYFKFKMTDEGYILNGLTEKGRNVENIRIPGFYKGNRVIQLAKFTQSNKVTNIVIPPCQTLIEDGFFSSFPKLKAVHILEGNPNNISVGFNLLQGATGVKIYIDKTSISSYLVDYYWSRYSSNLEVDE